eukprot:637751-Pelagomonas_calceolata.AAC.4
MHSINCHSTQLSTCGISHALNQLSLNTSPLIRRHAPSTSTVGCPCRAVRPPQSHWNHYDCAQSGARPPMLSKWAAHAEQ